MCVAAKWYFRHLGLNVSFFWDSSHGHQNNFKGMLNDMDLMPFWVLMMVTWNVASGPRADNTRWADLLASWQRMFNNLTPATCPLFQEAYPSIEKRLRGLGLVSGYGDCTQEVWKYCKANPPTTRPVPKVNFNRFFSTQRKAAQDLDVWTEQKLNVTTLALDEDMLRGKVLQKIVVRQPGLENVATTRQTTDSNLPTYCDKALRNIKSNAVVVAVAMRSEEENKFVVASVVEASAPTERAHSHQNTTCRDVVHTSEWLKEQASGAFFKHVNETFAVLRSPSSLTSCGVLLAHELDARESPMDAMEVVQQDDRAAVLGKACVAMSKNETKRFLYLTRGWPHRFNAMLDPLRRQRIATAFRRDLKGFEYLRDAVAQTEPVRQMLSRSCFYDTSVKQYVKVPFCVCLSSLMHMRSAAHPHVNTLITFGFHAVVIVVIIIVVRSIPIASNRLSKSLVTTILTSRKLLIWLTTAAKASTRHSGRRTPTITRRMPNWSRAKRSFAALKKHIRQFSAGVSLTRSITTPPSRPTIRRLALETFFR